MVVERDADRKAAARGQHLAAPQAVAAHVEHGQRVAARVDRVEQAARAVVGERALGREVVDDRAVELAAAAAGRIGARVVELPVGAAVVGDDGVTGHVVGLHEQAAAARVGLGGRREGGGRERGDRQGGAARAAREGERWHRASVGSGLAYGP